ncbi:hypothetical protein JVT61DRAFT_10503 [Boletus reticuloceps]|uniref:Uncharacterized protein n=1 Tax=Boletus reticuloceps TaxID=495285 RepID=A0A8I3AC43_9AGAM|nr:hypothetical protein JVT61DRAFT_10503 [Boletus reticuloceps]
MGILLGFAVNWFGIISTARLFGRLVHGRHLVARCQGINFSRGEDAVHLATPNKSVGRFSYLVNSYVPVVCLSKCHLATNTAGTAWQLVPIPPPLLLTKHAYLSPRYIPLPLSTFLGTSRGT